MKLKWGIQYKGTLVSIDGYMNIHLAETEEWDAKDVCKGQIGDCLIRCNNVLYVRDAENVEDV